MTLDPNIEARVRAWRALPITQGHLDALALLDEVERLRDALADEHAGRCADQLDLAGARAERDGARAACAEMRAALEAVVAMIDVDATDGYIMAVDHARALLSRPDLGAGMVVPRGVVERVRDVLARLPRAGWGYTDAERAAIADLDALLKQGGG